MEVEFADNDLDRLDTDASFTMGLSSGLVTAYRKRLQGIKAAVDERDLREMRGWRLEKLKGKRQHQSSIQLNDQFRLVVEFLETSNGKRVRIVGVEDYH